MSTDLPPRTGTVRRDLGKPSWPVGDYKMLHGALQSYLRNLASLHGQRALKQLETDDRLALLDAAVSCGSAVEFAAKAALVELSPHLITARAAPVSTTLHLAGLGHLSKSDPAELRTLGGVECMVLLQEVRPIVGYEHKRDDLVFSVRNAAIHMGFVDRAAIRRAVTIMARLLNQIASELWKYENLAALWGSQDIAHLAADRMSGALSELVITVQGKVASAKARIDPLRVIDDLDSYLIGKGMDEPSAQYDYWGHTECLACPADAWLGCSIEEDLEFDSESEPHRVLTAWPQHYECTACGLTLGRQEISVARSGLDSPFEADEDRYEPVFADLPE